MKILRSFTHLLLTLGWAVTAAAASPNIVVVLADDVGFSDFGCYGSEIETPNIDRLAANGIRFTNFHTENKCAPTRASLVTGRYYIHGYHQPGNLDIAEGLSLKGYKSCLSGKWSPANKSPGGPLTRGYDRFYGFIASCGSHFAPLGLQREGKPAEHEWKESKEYYFSHAVTDAAVQYIRETPQDRPLFLHVTYTEPHWPMQAPAKDVAKYRGKYAAGWDVLQKNRLARMKEMGLVPKDTPLPPRDPRGLPWEKAENKEWEQRRMEVYAAMIDSLDQGVGKIVAALKETGRYDDTLFIVTADNGASSEDYGTNRRTESFLNTETHDGRPMRVGNDPSIMPGPEDTWQTYGRNWAALSATPFRLYKAYEHRGGISEPLVVQWPKVITRGGQISDELCHVIDIMPTVLDAAGVAYPPEFKGRKLNPLDGKSLLPVLQGKPRAGHDALYWGCLFGKAVQQGKWKLVRQDEKPWELYDTQKDFNELNNLAAQHPEKVASMEKAWQAWEKSAELPKRNNKE